MQLFCVLFRLSVEKLWLTKDISIISVDCHDFLHGERFTYRPKIIIICIDFPEKFTNLESFPYSS
jgi:hypothetical protein